MIWPPWNESRGYSRLKSMRKLHYDSSHGVVLLNQAAKRLLRELAVLCEEPTTTTEDLVAKIALRNTQVCTEHEASQYPCHVGNSAHRVKSPDALIYDNGPALPRHPAIARSHLHAGLLPTNAQPQRRLQ